MQDEPHRHRIFLFRLSMGDFWSGDLGLTLVTIALAVLIFVTTPLGEAGLHGRVILDVVVVALMVSGALVVDQGRIASVVVIAVVVASAVVLGAGRVHPTPFLHELGSVCVTLTLLVYLRIVLLVMFRGGPVTWSRIQGGVSAYLLVGMIWASAFQLLEQLHPGSFQFISTPADIDQLTSKLTYYSFATLTTLGGDIAPISPFARSLTIAEAAVGQLLPPVLLGALVAMALQPRPKA